MLVGIQDFPAIIVLLKFHSTRRHVLFEQCLAILHTLKMGLLLFLLKIVIQQGILIWSFCSWCMLLKGIGPLCSILRLLYIKTSLSKTLFGIDVELHLSTFSKHISKCWLGIKILKLLGIIFSFFSVFLPLLKCFLMSSDWKYCSQTFVYLLMTNPSLVFLSLHSS